jgi:hypothetical protein
MQTGNKDKFLSTDFGLREFNVRSEKERVRRYRKYMYEAGSINRPEKGKIKVIDPRVLAREKRKGFEITTASRLRYRTAGSRIRPLSGRKSSYPPITSASRIISCRNTRKSQSP